MERERKRGRERSRERESASPTASVSWRSTPPLPPTAPTPKPMPPLHLHRTPKMRCPPYPLSGFISFSRFRSLFLSPTLSLSLVPPSGANCSNAEANGSNDGASASHTAHDSDAAVRFLWGSESEGERVRKRETEREEALHLPPTAPTPKPMTPAFFNSANGRSVKSWKPSPT